ncbi:MAG: hypothetical protein GX765_06265 [Candidatus Moranbacteria bacterium]|nr:hypothetical protein [Candidatus Moranbacteria bacterium]
MKVKLNLLPKNKERKLKNKKILQFLIWQELIILVATVFFFGLMMGIGRVADLRLGQMSQEISSNGRQDEYKQIREYENNIKTSIERINLIDSIQKSQIDWINIFSKFSIIFEEGISVDSIKGDGYTVAVDGMAENRDALIRVKKSLEEDMCFEEVNVPLNDIVLNNDIEFQIKFKVSDKCLKDYEK